MNTPKLLSSTDRTAACNMFGECLNEVSGTKCFLLVLGDDAVANKGRQYVKKMLEQSPEEFVSVTFIFVPTTYFLAEALKALPLAVKPVPNDFSWDNYNDYSVLAISPNNHYVSAYVKRSEIDASPGKIKIAILRAMGNGTL